MSTNLRNDSPPPKRFQFRLMELFVFITVFCITFGLLGRFGFQGLAARLIGTMLVITPLLLLIFVLDFYHWLKIP